MAARIAAVLLTTNVSALDNEIKVLVVMAPGAAVYDEQTITIDRLETSWSGAGSPSALNPLSVVNSKNAFGNHIKPVLTGPVLTTTSWVSTYNALTNQRLLVCVFHRMFFYEKTEEMYLHANLADR